MTQNAKWVTLETILDVITLLTDEVELEQSCQEGRPVWSVKIRRVRLTRCVFRYGPRDGMTYSISTHTHAR